jgi:octaprenyl-diphosphate synthase
MMVRAQSMAIMDLLANTTNIIAQGEVLQLLNIHEADTSEDRYNEVIYAKTACLFEAAARIGAMLGQVSSEQELALQAYGKHLGIAFQLIDDALDYSASSEALGKNVGDDLAEGKPTLPLIRAMEVGNDSQRQLLREAIENGQSNSFDEIRQVIADTGALQYTIERAQSEAQAARRAIAGLDDSEYRQAMIFLADYAVERSY